MRFDEFVEAHGLAVTPVEQFPGFVVRVGMPSGWQPLESASGISVWVRVADPRVNGFCANAVLTMHRVEAVLNVGEVCSMLADQQVASTPGCRETQRELHNSSEGIGALGMLSMQIISDLGIIDSRSRTRVLSTGQETLIAQLTMTALLDSPTDQKTIWMTVRSASSVGHSSVVPAGRLRGDH